MGTPVIIRDLLSHLSPCSQASPSHRLRGPIHRRTLPAVSGGPGNSIPWTETGSRCAPAQREPSRRCPRNGKRTGDREEPLCPRHGKVRSRGRHVHSRARRPAGDTHSATRVGRCQTGYDICISQPSVVSTRALRDDLDARGVCRSRQMTFVIAAVHPLAGRASSIAPLENSELTSGPISAVFSRGPGPGTEHSALARPSPPVPSRR